MRSIFVIFFIILFSQNLSHAEIIKNLIIEGNNRVSNSSIENIISFKKNKNYNAEEINNFQKKLFKTNFFKNIKIIFENNNLKLIVEENPIINFFYIDGVINNSRKDFIYEKINLGQNKVFSESLLKQDIEMIKKVYEDSGFLGVSIDPSITKLTGNTVNVILKIKRGEKIKVKRIYFIGDKYFSSSKLADEISSQEHGWWKFLSSSSSLNKQRVDFDKKLLTNFYLSEGFYDAQISSVSINPINEYFSDIVFSINSGKKYSFSNFVINDEFKILNKENIESIKLLAKKSIKDEYSIIKLRKVREKIFEYLIQKKIEFVDFDIIPNKESDNKIKINISFKKTPSRFVNNIVVTGNTITDESVIRRNLFFAEGDSFAEYKLQNSIRNLENSGIFKKINTDVKKNKNQESTVDVVVNVEEQPTGSISAGIGLGTSGSSISTGIQEKNLFGRGISANSNISLGTEKISGIANFTVPDFKNSGNDFGIDVFAISTDYSNAGYESTKAGTATSINYDIYEDVSLTTGISVDRDSIDASSTASAKYKSREGDYLTYKGFYKIQSDKRDRKYQPTKGYRIGLNQGLAIPGSDISYIDTGIFGSIYAPISDKYIFNFKAGLNSINSLNDKDIKLSDRKFLSSKNLRGFEAYGIGPKDGTDHVGGNYSAYTSISSTVPNLIPDKYNAKSIIFLDAGNVWGVDYDSSLDSDKIRSSIGIALDWISPLGPLSFTFSETISSAEGDIEESFSFQIGSSF